MKRTSAIFSIALAIACSMAGRRAIAQELTETPPWRDDGYVIVRIDENNVISVNGWVPSGYAELE